MPNITTNHAITYTNVTLSLGRAVIRLLVLLSYAQAKSSSIDSRQNGTFADYHQKTNNVVHDPVIPPSPPPPPPSAPIPAGVKCLTHTKLSFSHSVYSNIRHLRSIESCQTRASADHDLTWERRGLGSRNGALTTYKAVTLRGGQRIIAVFFPQ